jgi:hypothetical protein
LLQHPQMKKITYSCNKEVLCHQQPERRVKTKLGTNLPTYLAGRLEIEDYSLSAHADEGFPL